MFSSRFVKMASQNQAAWKAGLAVVVAGTMFKVTYFRFSRGIMVETMDERHIKATAHLKEARTFGSKMLEKSEGDAPPLTPKQKEQLQQYLRLMKEGEPDVYPLESKRWE